MKIPRIDVQAAYNKFIGGLDQESPAITFPPGALFASMNYIPEATGGYSRIDGYERFSGKTSPSDASYVYLECTFVATVSVGDTITGATSGATGVVILVTATYICVTKVTDTFQEEYFTVAAVTKGTITKVTFNGQPAPKDHATTLVLAAANYRTDIAKPSGSLPVRGIGSLKGVRYAFVDNSGGTAGEIYKETTSGWSKLTLYNEISFDTGVGTIADGDTITQLVSGATALVKRAVKESGDWASDATGRLIIDTPTGTFNAVNDLQVGAVTQATATSLVTAITIDPAGRYETIEYNFSGNQDKKRIYGCDGVNRAFELGDDIYVPLTLPSGFGVPDHIEAHKLQLFLSYLASSINSEPGNPYEFTAIAGALEIALGDNISGFKVLPGDALGIFSRDSSKQLLGDNVDNFVLDNISDDIGAIPYSIQKMNYVFMLDDRGIIKVTSTDAYGNFITGNVSKRIQKAINNMRSVLTASSVYRAKDQYRLYGSDGSGICMTMVGEEYHFSLFSYPDNIVCAHSCEDANGKDVVFLGSDDGWIYQADKGTSFDGEDIEAFAMLPFNNFESPTVLKYFRRAIIELTTTAYAELKFTPEFSYSNVEIPQSILNEIIEYGVGGLYDVDNWDEFYYDSQLIANPSFKLYGTGLNLSLLIASDNNFDSGHKLDGIIIHFTPRRIQR